MYLGRVEVALPDLARAARLAIGVTAAVLVARVLNNSSLSLLAWLLAL